MVEWHFAHIQNRWTKRALASAGFGYPIIEPNATEFSRWKPVFSVAEIGGSDSAAQAAEYAANRAERKRSRSRAQSQPDIGDEIENSQVKRRDFHVPTDGDRSSSQDSIDKTLQSSKVYGQAISKVAVVHGVNRPLFHMDLTSALQSAIANIQRYQQGEPPVGQTEEIIGGPAPV